MKKEETLKSEAQKIKAFTDLKAWQESRKLARCIYRVCYLFPPEEQYGLVSQMKRASISIASNIAEGFSRDTMKDKIRFYVMSHGSLTELQNQIIIAHDLGFIHERDHHDLLLLTDRVKKILVGLIRASKERANLHSPFSIHHSGALHEN